MKPNVLFGRIVVFAAAVSVAAASAAIAAAPSICVNPGGTGGCLPSVQAAVDAAPKRRNVTITIAAGTYREHVTIPSGKNLSLTGGTPLPSDSVISGVTVPPSSGSTITVQKKAKLLLRNLTITGGSAPRGGGINSLGKLSVSNSVISGNTATGGASQGGGIYFAGTALKVSQTKVNANQAGVGGGIYLSRGTANLNDTQMASNAASSDAGGIALDGGLLQGLNLYLAGNTAGGHGGGIALQNGKLKTGNTTLSGNDAGARGGGLAILGSGTALLNNSSIAGNSARDDGGIANAGKSRQAVKIANSLLAGNSTTPVTGGVNKDCSGVIRSLGYNLLQTASTGCSLTGSGKGDQIGFDPNLSGFTCDPLNIVCVVTFPPASRAVGGGNPAIPNGVGNHCLPTDALGTARSKGMCDIGAYQLP